MPRSERSAPHFEIWQSPKQIVSIASPVRLEILRLLTEKPRTLGHLVASTGKAKSTLSAVHLSHLLRTGLVEEKQDPGDARVKWYKLAGRRLGTSDVDKGQLRQAVLNYAADARALPLHPMLEILDLAGLARCTDKPYAESTAHRLGRFLGRRLADGEPRRVAAELSSLLEHQGLGTVTWRTGRAWVHASQPELRGLLRRVVGAALAERVGHAVRVD